MRTPSPSTPKNQIIQKDFINTKSDTPQIRSEIRKRNISIEPLDFILGKGRNSPVTPHRLTVSDDSGKPIGSKIVACKRVGPAEAAIHMQLTWYPHPNIVSAILIEGIPGSKDKLLYMSYCEGSLRQLLNHLPAILSSRDYKPAWNPAARYFLFNLVLGIMAGVRRFHQGGCAHQDMKPDNTLVTQKGIARICDLEFAAEKEIKGGTPQYMPPEIFIDSKNYHPFKGDAYAISMMVRELLECFFWVY